MNGFERISATLDGREVDAAPIMLHNFMFAAREANLTMREFRSCPKKMSRTFIDCSLKYGLDGILTDVDTALEAFAMGAATTFPDDLPAKVVAPISDRIEEVIEATDPAKLRQDERVQIYLEAIRLMREEVGGEIFIRGNADQGPFSLAAAVYGLPNMMMGMTAPENEALIFKLIECCYDVHLSFHQMVADAGADMTSFGDSMASPDLISPKMYKKFVAPFHTRLVRELAEDKIRTVCHVCGKTDLILEPLAEHRFAGVEIDYKTDIVKARDCMKNRSVVFGIVDPSGVFCLGDEAAITEATTQVLRTFHGRGLVIGAGCALPAETPADNIRTFVRIVRRFKL
ncbi:MAG: uroporphyrinogen decarboxylase family protein [Thermoguttaceae bacterium]